MKKHTHHIIPRSRGGSDDPTNLILLTPYEHAYHHALDFIEGGPMFDCRQEGWKLLPDWLREEVRKEKSRRMSTMRKGAGNSPTTRAAVSKRHKGVPKDPEHRRKISEALRGKPKSKETRKKLQEAWERRRQRPVSEETRAKMREAHLKRWAEIKRLKETNG